MYKGVFVNIWAVHHDPATWTEPEKYNPARFLSADGKSVIQHGSLITFGTGRKWFSFLFTSGRNGILLGRWVAADLPDKSMTIFPMYLMPLIRVPKSSIVNECKPKSVIVKA